MSDEEPKPVAEAAAATEDSVLADGSDSPAPPEQPAAATPFLQFGSVRVQQQQPPQAQGDNNNNTNNNNNDPNSMELDWTQMAADAPVIRYPSDVFDLDYDETEILIVGTAGQKITHIGRDFSHQVSPQLTSLVLRSHMIHAMEGLEGLVNLDVLELYDNQVQALECLGDGVDGAPGRNLRVLDISYNSIRDLQPVELCPNLQELCEFIVLCGSRLSWVVIGPIQHIPIRTLFSLYSHTHD